MIAQREPWRPVTAGSVEGCGRNLHYAKQTQKARRLAHRWGGGGGEGWGGGGGGDGWRANETLENGGWVGKGNE